MRMKFRWSLVLLSLGVVPIAPTAGASRNLLTGNTSFEIGTGSWCTKGTIDETTSAVGRCSLKGRDEYRACPTGVIRANRPYTLSFYAKTTGTGTVCVSAWMGYVRVIDCQRPLTATWTRFTVPLAPMANPAGMTLSFSSGNPKEPIWLDGVQLEEGTEATEYADADAVSFHATSGSRAEVVVWRENLPLTMAVSVFNSRCPPAGLPISMSCQVSEISTGPIFTRTRTLNVGAGQTEQTTVEVLPKMRPGYFPVRFILRDRSGTLLKELVCPVAVVQKPNTISIADGFFGLHTDGLAVGGETLHAIGVNWIRHGGALWESVEKEQGKFEMPPGLNVIREGFGPLVTMLTVPPPAWARGKNGFPVTPESISGYINKVLETYRKEITYYDFHNEPDLTLPYPCPDREKNFAALLNVAHPSFKARGAKLVVNVCGDAMPFMYEVIKYAPGAFDVFAPHPYANPRYLGPAGMALGPELGGMKTRLEDCVKLFRSKCPDRELWIGELGWGLDARVGIDSPWAVRHGAYLARAHLIARSVPELRRVIWFRDIGCVEGGYYEYGIWRGEDGLRPLPAVAAYATVAQLLDGAKPLRIVSDYDVKIYAFKKGDRVVVAAWDSLDDDALEPLEVEVPRAEGKVWMMTGAEASAKPGDESIALMTIGSNPSYAVVKAGGVERLVGRIRSALLARRPVGVEVGLPHRTTLSVVVKNKLTVPYAAGLAAFVGKAQAGARRPIDLAPGGSAAMDVELKPPLGLAGGTVRFDLTPRTGGQVVTVQKVLPPMRPCRRVGAGWDGVHKADLATKSDDLLVLDRREQVLPADPTIGWDGPNDLSARASVTWDADFLYFAADVTDDIHGQPNTNGDIWWGDCVQLAIDTRNDAQPNGNYDANDYEYGFALGPKNQSVVWRWQAPPGVSVGRVETCRTRIERIGTRTVYRVAVPWRELAPLKPKPGTVFGLNFIVAENEGHGGRAYWIGLTPGIAEAKLPALFEKFVLVE